MSSMQCKSTNFGPADYKVKKVARPPPTRATPSASVALPNPTVTQPWTSSGQRISSGNQHKTMATSAMVSVHWQNAVQAWGCTFLLPSGTSEP